MARLHSITALARVAALAIALPLALGGCVGALVVGGLAAAAGGGYAASQERGVNGSVDDFTIKTNIERELMQAQLEVDGGINATVYDGRVLLTGRVPSQETRASAEQVAGKIPGVRALYNEIEVARAEGVWDDANDTRITAQLRSQLVFDPDVRSINYTIDTTNGTVYLIGSARSQSELDRANQIARYVPGVRRVVSYVEIRGGAPVAAMPPPPMSGARGPAGPSAAPQGSIEVQKL